MNSVTAACLLFALVVPTYCTVLPSDIPTCKKSNPNFNKCAIAVFESIRHRLKAGIPEINVPPYDPHLLPKLKIDRERPNLRIRATARNIVTMGISQFQIEKLNIDVNNYTVDVVIKFPEIYITCNYNVRGSRLFVFPMDSKGFLQANITNVIVKGKGSAREVQKDGQTFLELVSIGAKFGIGGIQVHFDSSRPVVAEATDLFINNNQRVVLDIITPIAEEYAPVIATPIIGTVLQSIPLAELLPDD